MDRQEGIARKVRKLIRNEKYEEVLRIAEGMNLNKLTNTMLVMDIATAYEIMGDSDEAKELLLYFYNKRGGNSRAVLEKLIDLCIETSDINNAVKLCLTFEKNWPEDSKSLLMRYRITAAAKGSYAEQASYLEQYKQIMFDERWGYELAEIYWKDNDLEHCAGVCHDIILYFGEGEYVERAARMKHSICGLAEDEVETLSRVYPAFRNYGKETPAEAASEETSEGTLEAGAIGAESLEEEYASVQPDMEFTGETDEELAREKAQYYVDEKLKQTEELARQRKEREKQMAESRNAILENALHKDRYEDVEKRRVPSSMEHYQGPVIFTGNDLEATVNEILSQFHRRMQAEIGNDDMEYITVGRNTESYAEAIEERIRNELYMLSEDQVAELTDSEVKEIHELIVLRDLRAQVAGLVREALTDLPDIDIETVTDDLAAFEDTDPYDDLAKEIQAQEEARKKAEAEAEAKARAAALARTEEEARRRAEAKAQEALRAQEEALRAQMEAEAEVAEDQEGYEAEEGLEVQEANVAAEDLEVQGANVAEAGPEVQEANVAAEDLEVQEANVAAEDLKVQDANAAEAGPEVQGDYAAEEDRGAQDFRGQDGTSEAEVEDLTEESFYQPYDDGDESLETIALKDIKDVREQAETSAPVVEELHQVKKSILDEIQNPDASLTAEDFLACVCASVENQDFLIDERAYMTISVIAEEMVEDGFALSKNNAIAMAEEAIRRGKKRSPLDKLFSGKSAGNKLKDRHFDWKDSMNVSPRTKVLDDED